MSIQSFTQEYLSTLVNEAGESPRSRQHRNIHTSYDDPCQRFMNAIAMDSYIRPHRHALDPKAETLIAIKGLFALIRFDDTGTVQEIIQFGTEKFSDEIGVSAGVDLSPGIWHTIIALKPGSVLLELKAGPFNPQAAKEPALWAPEEGSALGQEYLQQLRSLIRS
jgi:cupin fold WbuC family metalloprotein